jgi:hypothetical protein
VQTEEHIPGLLVAAITDTFFRLSRPSCSHTREKWPKSSADGEASREGTNQFGEELVDDALRGLVGRVAVSLGRQSVKLIEEDDARR